MSSNLRRIARALLRQAAQQDHDVSVVFRWPETACPLSVAAEQEHPRLHVWRSPLLDWWWQVTGPHGEQLDDGVADTHAEALAVGLAALEVASLPGSVTA